MTSLVETVRSFRGLRALVIGDAMLDSYLEGRASRLCREGPVPVVTRTGEERVPGGAANAAANLRALGAQVALLGMVGEDPPGALLRSALRDLDVDTRLLEEHPSVRTLHKLRILADGQYVVRYDEGETRAAAPFVHERLLAHLEEAFSWCDLVVVSDYGYGAASEALLRRLRELRRERPCVLLVDAKHLGAYASAGATVVTPNLLEARLSAEPGLPADLPLNLPAAEATGRRLLGMLDAEHAAITLAGDGVMLVSRDGMAEHLPARAVEHANDIGAGDSFSAATALALAAGAPLPHAARIGILAAGIAVAKPRTSIVQDQELLQRVSLEEYSAAADGDGAGHGVDAPGHVDAVPLLARRLDAERLAGKRIVFTNGVFDMLHAGHVGFLRRARELGDVLVVGVNGDAGARSLKGRRSPLNSERDRLALVRALDSVDHAVLFDEGTPAELIRALRPHIHVKGGDYAREDLPEAEAVREVGARTRILPLEGGPRPSEVAERIAGLSHEELAEALG